MRVSRMLATILLLGSPGFAFSQEADAGSRQDAPRLLPPTDSQPAPTTTASEPISITTPETAGPSGSCSNGACPRCWAPVIRPRLTVRHDFGEGPGFQEGFTYLEGFLPLAQQPGRWIVFHNARAVNFDHHQLWEFNGGLGARLFNPQTCRVLGAHGHYDGRTTLSDNFFHQVTFGVESLGRYLDFRANCYLPVGADRQQTFDGFVNPRFQGFNILLDRVQASEVALGGADAEVGGPIPYLSDYNARAYLGYYHYSNHGLEGVNGIRGRMEATVNDRLSLHLSVQNDAVFDTTIHGGFALHFGPGRRTQGGGDRGQVYRLGDRVVRDPNIAMTNNVVTTPTVATDTNGNPLLIRHANSNSPAGGDGTFERPFQTLGDLQNGSNPKEILYAHAGSVFMFQEILLQPGQRFLGEGALHLIQTAQGTFILPRATNNSAMPIIQDSSFAAVTLADNTEVSGFHIIAPAGFGVFGEDVNGNVRIAHNVIQDAGFAGILLDQCTNTNLNVAITNNQILNSCPCPDGIVMLVEGTANFNALVAHNVITGGTNGITLIALEDSRVNASILGNTISEFGCTGIDIVAEGNAIAAVQVARNNIQSCFGCLGVLAESNDKATLGLQLFGNVTDLDFELNRFGCSIFRLEETITSNTFLNGSGAFVDPSITLVPFGFHGFPAP